MESKLEAFFDEREARSQRSQAMERHTEEKTRVLETERVFDASITQLSFRVKLIFKNRPANVKLEANGSLLIRLMQFSSLIPPVVLSFCGRVPF